MWFDPRAALAEIRAAAPLAKSPVQAPPPANTANPAKRAGVQADDLAGLAALAAPWPSDRKNEPVPASVRPAAMPSAPAVPLRGGMVATWCGVWVSREQWDAMSDMERYGPQGRLFCGKCWQWQNRDTALACLDGRPCQ